MADEPESGAPRLDDRAVSGPLVFISHDSRDALLAEAFSKLLASVSAGMLKTFRSSDRKGSQGFEYGVEWYPELMNRLESACDVVCLLTERSLGRPWLLYEAGVAKGKLSIPVHGLALGVPLAKASAGPFAQFQNCDNDLDSITKLVVQLVRRLPHADPDQETVKVQVSVFKDKVEEALAEHLGDDGAEDLMDGEPSSAKLFEEVKVMFQDLPSRLEHIVIQSGREPRSRLMRWPPEALEEIMMVVSRGERRPGIMALIIGSLFRDEVPWLCEMGVEAYRTSLLGNPDAERRAYQDFARACEFMTMGPPSRELRSSRELHMLMRYLPRLLDRWTTDLDESPAPPPEGSST